MTKTRTQCRMEALICLEAAQGLYQEAEERHDRPDFEDAHYWVTRAQVYATLALTAEY